MEQSIMLSERESLLKEIRFLKVKVLMEMIAGSLILFLWFTGIRSEYIMVPRIYISFCLTPLIFNILPWFTWLMVNYLLFIRQYYHRSLNKKYYEQYYYDKSRLEYYFYYIIRLRRLELITDISIAFQFLSMAVIYALPFFSYR